MRRTGGRTDEREPVRRGFGVVRHSPGEDWVDLNACAQGGDGYLAPMKPRSPNETPRKQMMSVILDIDLDYFPLFDQPLDELERLLAWAGRPVDFVVEQHHEAYRRWKQMVATHVVQPPRLIIHVDEHHDMMSERPPANLGNFVYFAMRHWPDCRVVWVMPQPIDYPDLWLSDDAWAAVSSRFECARRFRRRWPKPDVVSVCTSPEFIDADLSRRLLERLE
jgi:hypothetical protein